MTPAAATTGRLVTGRGSASPRRLSQPGDQGGCGDHQDDEQPGEVLHPPEAVGEPAARRAARQREGDPQRNRGQRVGQVVHGVGEQRHRPRHGDDALQEGGAAEDDEADPDRAHAVGAGLEGGVGGLGRVVAVRPDHVQQPAEQALVARARAVLGRVLVLVLVPCSCRARDRARARPGGGAVVPESRGARGRARPCASVHAFVGGRRGRWVDQTWPQQCYGLCLISAPACRSSGWSPPRGEGGVPRVPPCGAPHSLLRSLG